MNEHSSVQTLPTTPMLFTGVGMLPTAPMLFAISQPEN